MHITDMFASVALFRNAKTTVACFCAVVRDDSKLNYLLTDGNMSVISLKHKM